MGLSLETFLGQTPSETIEAYIAWKKQKQEDFENENLARWRIARWQSWVALYPPRKKKANEFDILPLRGDDELKEVIKRQQEEEKAKQEKAPMKDARRFKAITHKWPAPKKIG